MGAIRVGCRIVYVELSLSLSLSLSLFFSLSVSSSSLASFEGLRGNGGGVSRFTMMARFPLCPPRVRRHRQILASLDEIFLTGVEGRIPRTIIARKNRHAVEYHYRAGFLHCVATVTRGIAQFFTPTRVLRLPFNSDNHIGDFYRRKRHTLMETKISLLLQC